MAAEPMPKRTETPIAAAASARSVSTSSSGSLGEKLKPFASPGGALVALGVYESAAAKINEAAEERLLPTITAAVEGFTWGKLRRRLFPSWAPLVTYSLIGFAINAAQARRRKAKGAGKR